MNKQFRAPSFTHSSSLLNCSISKATIRLRDSNITRPVPFSFSSSRLPAGTQRCQPGKYIRHTIPVLSPLQPTRHLSERGHHRTGKAICLTGQWSVNRTAGIGPWMDNSWQQEIRNQERVFVFVSSSAFNRMFSCFETRVTFRIHNVVHSPE